MAKQRGRFWVSCTVERCTSSGLCTSHSALALGGQARRSREVLESTQHTPLVRGMGHVSPRVHPLRRDPRECPGLARRSDVPKTPGSTQSPGAQQEIMGGHPCTPALREAGAFGVILSHGSASARRARSDHTVPLQQPDSVCRTVPCLSLCHRTPCPLSSGLSAQRLSLRGTETLPAICQHPAPWLPPPPNPQACILSLHPGPQFCG